MSEQQQQHPIQVVALEVDGAPGHDGAHGHRGADGSGYGADGHPGQPAGPATPGLPGGQLAVVLAGERARCRLDQAPRDVALTPITDLDLSARGGKGGDGGRGGDGGHGARGRPGRDATRHSSGGDGGPGGDGGAGAPGSHGADGGPGGRITVAVNEAESYLLMAVRGCEAPAARVDGGPGGHRGAHGHGGAGGSGGSGGSSYSWTESESYTDSQGNRQTRTKHHRNSGGSSGRPGNPGPTPSFPLADGRHGAAGVFEIHLFDPHGRRATVYPHRYDLVLDAFEFAEADGPNADGIFEFGEIVEVTGLVLRNVGAMPTPPEQRIRVTLQPRPWGEPLGDELFVEHSLAPGDSVRLEGRLRYRIPRPVIDAPAAPRVEHDVIAPAADQLGPEPRGRPAAETPFQRRYGNVTFTRGLEMRFPVENATDVRVLRSLAPGERSRLIFTVDNVSRRPVGRASVRRRRLQVQLEYVGGDIPVEDLVYVDHDGHEHRLEDTSGPHSGYVLEIGELDAGERFVLEGSVGFRRRVPAYCGATLRVTLWLESLALDGTLEVVQCREATLRAEPGYVATDDARVLLVTHDATTRALYDATNALLDHHLGLPADDWSLSRYGHFDHSAVLPDGRNLRAHLGEKLVVVFNDHFHPRSEGATELPTDYLRGRDFRESTTTSATRFLIIGSKDFALQQWLEPTSALRSGGEDYATLARYLSSVRRAAGTLTEELFGEDITTYFDRIEVVGAWFPFLKPSRLRLQKLAARLARKLRRIHPHRRYVIVHRAPEGGRRRAGRWLGVIPRWLLGELEVRRSLNLEVNTAVMLRVDDTVLDGPAADAFVMSEDVRFALLLALSFDAKLDRLNWLLQRPDELDETQRATARVLVRAMLVNLAEEQAALRTAVGRFDDAMIAERLSHLVRLRDCPLSTGLAVDSNKWQPLIELSAGLEALARSQRAWWALWGKQKRITRFTLAALEQFEYEIFSRFVIDPDGNVAMGVERAREQISPRVEALLAELKQGLGWFVRWLAHGRARRYALEHFQHPAPIGRTVMREIDSWRDAVSRVWSQRSFEKACAAEEERLGRQAELRARNASDRAEMLALPARTASEVEAAVVLEVEVEVR